MRVIQLRGDNSCCKLPGFFDKCFPDEVFGEFAGPVEVFLVKRVGYRGDVLIGLLLFISQEWRCTAQSKIFIKHDLNVNILLKVIFKVSTLFRKFMR